VVANRRARGSAAAMRSKQTKLQHNTTQKPQHGLCTDRKRSPGDTRDTRAQRRLDPCCGTCPLHTASSSRPRSSTPGSMPPRRTWSRSRHCPTSRTPRASSQARRSPADSSRRCFHTARARSCCLRQQPLRYVRSARDCATTRRKRRGEQRKREQQEGNTKKDGQRATTTKTQRHALPAQ
jgi:hypothetical protein